MDENNRYKLEKHCDPSYKVTVYDVFQESPAMEVISRNIFDDQWDLEGAIMFSFSWNRKDVFHAAIMSHDTDLDHGKKIISCPSIVYNYSTHTRTCHNFGIPIPVTNVYGA